MRKLKNVRIEVCYRSDIPEDILEIYGGRRYQCDVTLGEGAGSRSCHGAGETPGEAVMNAVAYWMRNWEGEA